ncbi:lipocalin-like domain-containing protein [Bosea sp. (in: a-proteobacteria)]|uniref:lipocalin-like domain-containing protein n=1 Tax=Bosea sp. (in: a-proteobacteria) TaxID=1871050 RepID=UPI00262E1374|nr:lipocalin-like domain-containing protein [Bosea sp. (in: a-proteobacteria)]MCO5091379.1 lipocalin-like domain-containing protein [Bosea sp. (in: a-proteobacteria)]
MEGIWRLVASKAWDEAGHELPAPYGRHPVGQLCFAHGRLLAALCNGDVSLSEGASRAYSSYGGVYEIKGDRLETLVDMASDPARIGGRQVREFRLSNDTLVLRPPLRLYGSRQEQRELQWVCIWRLGPANP